MKKYVKGEYIEMTEEEIAAMQVETPTEQPNSFEHRFNVIEQGFKKIEKLLSKLGV